jgi:hypothetical protein
MVNLGNPTNRDSTMKQRITLLIFLQITLALTGFTQFATSDALAGRPMMADADGKPLYLRSSYIAEGSPFLYDEYADADIVLMSGKVYPSQKVKINLLDKLFLYKNAEGVEIEITSPIRSIRFHEVGNGNLTVKPERTFQGFNEALNAQGAAVYEVVVQDSSALLLKHITVTYIDVKGYSEANTTRKFKHNQTYFAAIPPGNKELKKIEKNKAAVSALFGQQSTAIAQFINQKKLKCKSEEELIEVFKYYGTL